MEFFQFCPRQGETLRTLMQRFDELLRRANNAMELGISYPFRSWMLLSLLKLSANQWRDILKELGRRFPRDEATYKQMQQILIRERELMNVVGYMGNAKPGIPGAYFAEGATNVPDAVDGTPLPLYLCLGGWQEPPPATYFTGPTQDASSSVPALGYLSSAPSGSAQTALALTDKVQDADVLDVTLFDIADAEVVGSESESWETDSSVWESENREDPISPSELLALEEMGRDEQQLEQLYWTARRN